MPILLLPNRLQLLTLPKASLPAITHPLLRALFFPANRGALFSLTENALEISIVADIETLEHFSSPCPGLRVTSDIFRALQIETEDGPQTLDNAGRRINELSGPLAHAGVSIFYLSTYQTDLLFVKEKRLPVVVQALRDWDFVDLPDADLMDGEGSSFSKHTSVNFAGQQSLRSAESLSPPIPIPVRIPPSTASQLAISASSFENGSFSPTFGPGSGSRMTEAESDRLMNEVRRLTNRAVLGRTLRLCGLNRDYMDAWALKLIRVLFYPELLGGEGHDRFFSYTIFDEGISLVADEAIVAATFEAHHINISPRPLSCIQVDLDKFGLGKLFRRSHVRLCLTCIAFSDRFGIVFSMSDPLTQHAINLLYLSTYRTANVLVSTSDLARAMAILDDLSMRAEHDDVVESETEAVHGIGSIVDSTMGHESFSAHKPSGPVISVGCHRLDDDDDDDEADWKGKANLDDEELDFDRDLPGVEFAMEPSVVIGAVDSHVVI